MRNHGSFPSHLQSKVVRTTYVWSEEALAGNKEELPLYVGWKEEIEGVFFLPTCPDFAGETLLGCYSLSR